MTDLPDAVVATNHANAEQSLRAELDKAYIEGARSAVVLIANACLMNGKEDLAKWVSSFPLPTACDPRIFKEEDA